MSEADPISKLAHAFTRLPGIGQKSAQRLAFFILNAEEYVAQDLATALTEARQKVGFCRVCRNLTKKIPAASAVIHVETTR